VYEKMARKQYKAARKALNNLSSEFSGGTLSSEVQALSAELYEGTYQGDIRLDARGEKATLAGQIVFVDPLVNAGGKYRVRAEVDNRQIGRQWLLRPGMTAEMKIRLGP